MAVENQKSVISGLFIIIKLQKSFKNKNHKEDFLTNIQKNQDGNLIFPVITNPCSI